MPFETVWSHRASGDLIRIIEDLDTRDPDWADTVYSAISEKLDFISQFQFLSSNYDVTSTGEIREVLAANYQIFCTVIEHDLVVRLRGIQHARQDDPDFSE